MVVGVRQVFEHLNMNWKTVIVIWNTQTIEDVKRFKLRHNPYDPSFPADSHDLKIVLVVKTNLHLGEVFELCLVNMKESLKVSGFNEYIRKI